MNKTLSPRCDLHDFLEEWIPKKLSRGFMSVHDACMLCLFVGFCDHTRCSFLQFLQAFSRSHLATHGCLHGNFHFSFVFDGFFVLTMFHTDEINASQSSSIIEHWFFDSPIMLLLFLSCFRHAGQISGHNMSGLAVAGIFASRHPDHMYPLGRFSFNNVNIVNPFQ